MTLTRQLIEQLKLKRALTFPCASLTQIQTASIALVKAGFPKIPRGYATFLQLTDGLCWNELELFSCLSHERINTVFSQSDLMDYQQKYPLGRPFRNFLILGRATECLLCYDHTQKNYLLLDRLSLAPILKFPRFQDLLYHVLTSLY